MNDVIKENFSMRNLEIISLPTSQWEQYKRLRLEALKNDPQAFSSNYAREAAYPDEKWQKRVADANAGKVSKMYFAKLDGKLVGMVGSYRDDEGLINHKAEIWGVYVDPNYRGKGVAKSLMGKILEELEKDEDINIVKLGVNSDQQNAVRLYESFGFSFVKSEKHLMGDSQEHEISEMEKSLRDSGLRPE